MNKKMSELVLLAVIASGSMLSAQGCASGEPFAKVNDVPDGMGVVYLYRKPFGVGMAVSPCIMSDGRQICTLAPGEYRVHITKPGMTQYSSSTEATSTATVNVREGGSHYIRQDISMGLVVGRPKLTVLPESEALPEISGCKGGGSEAW